MENLETRLNEVARIAVRLEQETGCPARLMIAQWAIESSWGEKPVGHANYFGIKKADRHTKCCTVTTREVVNGKSVIENLEFADYDSLDDSCRDYAWLISRTTRTDFKSRCSPICWNCHWSGSGRGGFS
jgi:flagellar protein FlgJ